MLSGCGIFRDLAGSGAHLEVLPVHAGAEGFPSVFQPGCIDNAPQTPDRGRIAADEEHGGPAIHRKLAGFKVCAALSDRLECAPDKLVLAITVAIRLAFEHQNTHFHQQKMEIVGAGSIPCRHTV